MMTYAITPHGIGKQVGIRPIKPDWDLAAGETFKIEATDMESLLAMVLAEDGVSLRPGTPQELAPRRTVAKSLIIERLQAAGLLGAAKAALDSDLYARERWYAPDKPAIHADDAEALALLAAVGADSEAIMAP